MGITWDLNFLEDLKMVSSSLRHGSCDGAKLWWRGGQRAAEGRRVDVAQDVYFGGNSKGMKDLEFLDETVECYRSDFHP